MSNPHTPYTITAKCPDGSRAKTRSGRPSALTLANRWAEDGCYDVLICDPDGTIHDREEFRSTLLGHDPLGLALQLRS